MTTLQKKSPIDIEIIDTFPKMLIQQCKKNGEKIAVRKKEFGIWNEYTWEECYKRVESFSLGLASLGFNRGDKICYIGNNDPEIYWTILAAQTLGGVAVGMYPDTVPPEIEYLANHSDSRFAVAEDQEQVDKFLEIRDKLPDLKKVIYWDPKGMLSYKDDPFLIEFNSVIQLGEEYRKEHPSFFEDSIAIGKGDDIAILCYTSGTTGQPKGAMIHYDFFTEACRSMNMVNPSYEGDEWVSYMSPAWITDNFLGLAQWLDRRMVVNFPEEPETVQENIREIGPATVLLGARQWEGLISMVQMKMNDADPIQGLVFKLCMPIGNKVAGYKLKQEKIPWIWAFLYKLTEWICFRQIRDYLGVKKVRLAATGGAPLGPDAMTWLHALGINIKQLYGLTELVMMACHTDFIKPGTVGNVCPGTDIKISDEGEIIATSKAPFKGYYKNPEETARMMEGVWLHTGDAGIFDEDGQLVVIDRVKELLKLKDGETYSPTFIENRLKFSPYIKDTIVFGEGKDYIFAIINIDFDNVGRWAEKHLVPYTTYVDLSQKEEVNGLIRSHVDAVNKTLPPKARLKKYVILHKEFDPDEGELTRTRKLRRASIEERYGKTIDAAYTGKEEVVAEAEVKYRDGRRGKVTTEIRIRSIEEEDL